MTVKERAQNLADEATHNNVLSLFQLAVNSLKDENKSVHTITRFTTLVRSALADAGKSELCNLVTNKEARIEKRELDAYALRKYTHGADVITINNADELVKECAYNCKEAHAPAALIFSLALLTGRRTVEVVNIATKRGFDLVDAKHIRVNETAKGGTENIVIPVFGGAGTVAVGFKRLGELLEASDLATNEAINLKFGTPCNRYAKKVWAKYADVGENLKATVHTARKVYTAFCVHSVYECSTQIQINSRSLFVTHILGHVGAGADANYDFVKINSVVTW